MAPRFFRPLLWVVFFTAAAHFSIACSIEDPFSTDQANSSANVEPDSSDDSDTSDSTEDPFQDSEDEDTYPPSCADGLKNGDETDIDCGGPDCAPCEESNACLAKADCEGSLACINQLCQCLETRSIQEICAAASSSCGEITDQCNNPVQCGTCTEGICQQGQCVECTDDSHCSDQAYCDDNQCTSYCSPASTPFGYGEGSRDNPYLICAPHHLENIGTAPSSHFELAADLDLSSQYTMYPTGTQSVVFRGTLDGRGWEIQNLTIIDPSEKLALFYTLSTEAELKNLTLRNSLISGLSGSALVNENHGNITNCHVWGSVGGHIAGGLVTNNYGRITQSSFNGNVTGEELTGGLVATNHNIIDQSYTRGTISGAYFVGGLVGTLFNWALIQDSYSTATVSGEEAYAGRIAGEATGGTLQHIFAASVLPPTEELRLVGRDDRANLRGAYLRSLNCGSFDSSPEEICLDYDEFLEPGAFENWDFTSIWRMDNFQGHPVLQWE